MMAFERKPDGLDATLLAELRGVMARSLQHGAHGDDLKILLHRLAMQARERGVHSEQMLVALKDLWHTVPGISARPDDGIQVELLQELISLCIQEYYSR